MVILHVTFEELPSYFPQQLYLFTFPSVIYKGYSFFISSPTLVIFLFWRDRNNHLNLYKIVYNYGFDLHLMTSDVKYLFMLAICVSSEKCLLSLLLIFTLGFLRVFCCFWFRVLRVLHILWIVIPYRTYNAQIFSPIQWDVFLLFW